jgi:hypothetical protein
MPGAWQKPVSKMNKQEFFHEYKVFMAYCWNEVTHGGQKVPYDSFLETNMKIFLHNESDKLNQLYAEYLKQEDTDFLLPVSEEIYNREYQLLLHWADELQHDAQNQVKTIEDENSGWTEISNAGKGRGRKISQASPAHVSTPKLPAQPVAMNRENSQKSKQKMVNKRMLTNMGYSDKDINLFFRNHPSSHEQFDQSIVQDNMLKFMHQQKSIDFQQEFITRMMEKYKLQNDTAILKFLRGVEIEFKNTGHMHHLEEWFDQYIRNAHETFAMQENQADFSRYRMPYYHRPDNHAPAFAAPACHAGAHGMASAAAGCHALTYVAPVGCADGHSMAYAAAGCHPMACAAPVGFPDQPGFWDPGYFDYQENIKHLFRKGLRTEYTFNAKTQSLKLKFRERALYFYFAMKEGEIEKLKYYWNLLKTAKADMQSEIETNTWQRLEMSVFTAIKEFIGTEFYASLSHELQPQSMISVLFNHNIRLRDTQFWIYTQQQHKIRLEWAKENRRINAKLKEHGHTVFDTATDLALEERLRNEEKKQAPPVGYADAHGMAYAAAGCHPMAYDGGACHPMAYAAPMQHGDAHGLTCAAPGWHMPYEEYAQSRASMPGDQAHGMASAAPACHGGACAAPVGYDRFAHSKLDYRIEFRDDRVCLLHKYIGQVYCGRGRIQLLIEVSRGKVTIDIAYPSEDTSVSNKILHTGKETVSWFFLMKFAKWYIKLDPEQRQLVELCSFSCDVQIQNKDVKSLFDSCVRRTRALERLKGRLSEIEHF